MSNDDLFEDNEVVLDDTNLKEEEKSEDNDSGILADTQLPKILAEFVDKLNNTDQFSFSIFSVIYQDFIALPRAVISPYYSETAAMNIAIHKAALGHHEAGVLTYLYELQRKIQIMGFRDSYTIDLLQLLNDNIDNEPHDSFLTYFRDNLRKEVILNERYLLSLIEMYQNFCQSNDITTDPLLVEFQLKSFMSTVERKEYGTILPAYEVEGIGTFEGFTEQRDTMISEINQAVFRFINAVQSKIDTLKIEAERQ